ncbi:MAG: EscU/YscU/HrcU family type III secretion system export apparatus switch protein, partial [Pirellulaceae bacterium]|nr:EscU/YscU/HrcU family type III secretion system export apparatus switch protein [Pirellulaceae bacterium]
MSEYLGDKTFDPTPHRREQARREGHVARSRDLASAAMLLLALGVLTALGGSLAAFLVEFCRNQLGGQAW